MEELQQLATVFIKHETFEDGSTRSPAYDDCSAEANNFKLGDSLTSEPRECETTILQVTATEAKHSLLRVIAYLETKCSIQRSYITILFDILSIIDQATAESEALKEQMDAPSDNDVAEESACHSNTPSYYDVTEEIACHSNKPSDVTEETVCHSNKPSDYDVTGKPTLFWKSVKDEEDEVRDDDDDNDEITDGRSESVFGDVEIDKVSVSGDKAIDDVDECGDETRNEVGDVARLISEGGDSVSVDTPTINYNYDTFNSHLILGGCVPVCRDTQMVNDGASAQGDFKDTVHTQRDFKDTLHTQGDFKDTLHTQGDFKDTVHGQGDFKDTVHGQLGFKDTEHRQGDFKDTIHTQGEFKDKLHTQGDFKDTVHRPAWDGIVVSEASENTSTGRPRSRDDSNKLGSRSNARIHQCETCGTCVSRLVDLRRHMLIHTGEKPYGCTLCDKRFRLSDFLTQHMRTHTNEKPYECVVCNKRYRKSSKLKIHMWIHTGEKPHKCPICGKGFTRHAYCVTHQKRHAVETLR